jgi:hypothetical protein
MRCRTGSRDSSACTVQRKIPILYLLLTFVTVSAELEIYAYITYVCEMHRVNVIPPFRLVLSVDVCLGTSSGNIALPKMARIVLLLRLRPGFTPKNLSIYLYASQSLSLCLY